MTTGGQPAIIFLQQVRIFYQQSVVQIGHAAQDYTAVPGFVDVHAAKMRLYCSDLAPAAVVAACTDGSEVTGVNLDVLWTSVASDVPTIARLACNYRNAVANLAVEERSFSIKNLVFSEHDRSLSQKSLKAFDMLYHNIRMDAIDFD